MEKCAKVVVVQKDTIDKQDKLVKKQDEKIVILEERVEQLDGEASVSNKISIGSILLTILVILL